MRDSYVVGRLQSWAVWSWQRADGAFGYRVAQHRYEEWTPARTDMAADSPVASDAIETEGAVAWLAVTEHRIASAICVHYRDRVDWSAPMQSELLGCCVRTLWYRLNRGHTLVLGYLLDRDAKQIKPQLQRLRSTG